MFIFQVDYVTDLNLQWQTNISISHKTKHVSTRRTLVNSNISVQAFSAQTRRDITCNGGKKWLLPLFFKQKYFILKLIYPQGTHANEQRLWPFTGYARHEALIDRPHTHSHLSLSPASPWITLLPVWPLWLVFSSSLLRFTWTNKTAPRKRELLFGIFDFWLSVVLVFFLISQKCVWAFFYIIICSA